METEKADSAACRFFFMEHVLERFREFFWVVNGLIAFTLIAWLLDWDRIIAEFFFTPGLLSIDKWQGLTNPFWLGIYRTAALPALFLGGLSLVVLGLGFRYDRFRSWRRQSLFIILLMALGPGMLVNVLLKDALGRPRPSQLIEFGGEYSYSQFWEPGTGSHNGSFPSGHASIAFATMGPWFFLRQRHQQSATAFLAAGIGWGALVGAARILQGGHFFSDVVWAGGLVYLVGWLLAYGFSFDRAPSSANSG